MKKHIIKMLSLEGVKVGKIEVNEDIVVEIKSHKIQAICPKCGKICKKIYDHKNRKVTHGIFNNQKIILVVRQKRFKCQCGNIFTEIVSGISRKRYSENFQHSCISELVNTNFKTVANKYKVSTPTLVNFLKDHAKQMKLPEGMMRLNVDEHSFSGRDLKITIGELNSRRLLSILKDDNQNTLRKYFQTLKTDELERISEVCIDMKQSYLSVLKEELPNSLIVVDHFHVVKEMIRQCEEIRKILQEKGEVGWKRINRFLLIKNRENLSTTEEEKLKLLFKKYEKYPALKQCYLAKEMVRDMYKSKTRFEAEKKLERIILVLNALPFGKAKEMCNTLIRWKPYILNYFVSKTTNAFIEGCHNKIKLIKRMSYGFRNFENYVLKITLAFLPFLFQIFHTNV